MKFRHFLSILLVIIMFFMFACATTNIPTIAPPETNNLVVEPWMKDASAAQVKKAKELLKEGFLDPSYYNVNVFMLWESSVADLEFNEFAFSAASIDPNGRYGIFIYVLYPNYTVDVYRAMANEGPVLQREQVVIPENSPIRKFADAAFKQAPKGFKLLPKNTITS
ncbi:hypothetical protein KAR91_80760 [Candidatus Pacearchaeota archaeon]|nr:hypothetical protein [Candidatus Pacearchaeota archaeon]